MIIDVLVGTNSCSLECFRGQLLVLVGDHMYTEREVIDVGTLAAEIKDTDLGVRHTTVEAGFGIRLYRSIWSACFRADIELRTQATNSHKRECDCRSRIAELTLFLQ